MPLLEPLGHEPATFARRMPGPMVRAIPVSTSQTAMYIAFFDSDDVWLPDYLSTCVAAAAANPDVHWVYTACRVIDLSSRREL